MKYIVPKAYRVPKAPKNTVQNAKIISSSSQNKPRPLAEGGGEGSQRPSEVFRTQAKSRAKFNKDEKNPPAGGFFPWLMQCFWFYIVAGGDADYYARIIAMNYRALIPTLEFLVDLAFTVTFTACLVPTFYWIRGFVNKRKSKQ